MLLVLELDVGGRWKMVRNKPRIIFNKMYMPLKTRYLMFNSKWDYYISDKVLPGYQYRLAIPGYVSDNKVREVIYESWRIDSIRDLVEVMNGIDGHTGSRWKYDHQDDGTPEYLRRLLWNMTRRNGHGAGSS